ncbi:MAG: ABC transporter permease [Fibrobacterota bacterium]
METVDISIRSMAFIYTLLGIPLAILWKFKIPFFQKTLIAAARMTIQLILVGLYLKFIFEFNNMWINFTWIAFMIIIANFTVIRNAGLGLKRFFLPTAAGIAMSIIAITSVLVFLSIRPEPFYDARYLVPIAGMILGNCLRSNVISLERFYSTIGSAEKQYLTYLTMGATRYEAILPYMRAAVQASLAPTIATMATIGLVSLPGMMTGQILGGSFPLVAIKYQIAIMIAIFSATSIATLLNILLSIRFSFDDFDMLKDDVFGEKKKGE